MKSAAYIALCTKASLPAIRNFMERELIRMGIQESVAQDLVLAVDEAAANSIIHQHNCDGTSQFEIRLRLESNVLTIELRDKGEPFPIDEYKPEADMDSIIRARSKGGLGLLLISRIMDKVEVIRREDGFTYRFTKRI